MALPPRSKLAVLAAGAAILVSAGVLAQGAGESAPPPNPPPAKADAGASGENAAPKKPSVGYSWNPKKRTKRSWRRAKIDPNKPLATYPGFRMMPDGTSMIWLRISKKVQVTVRAAAGRVSYVLPEVQVGVHNNTNPLVTTHFDTPVSRAHLARTKQGAVLIVELREAVTPTHSVSDGPRGTMLLQVKLPKAQKSYSSLSGPPSRSTRTEASGSPRRGTPAPRTLPRGRGRGPAL